jgi:hypothetical protein
LRGLMLGCRVPSVRGRLVLPYPTAWVGRSAPALVPL